MKKKTIIICVTLLMLQSKLIIGGTFSHDMMRRYGINSHIMQTSHYFKPPKAKNKKKKTDKHGTNKQNHKTR